MSYPNSTAKKIRTTWSVVFLIYRSKLKKQKKTNPQLIYNLIILHISKSFHCLKFNKTAHNSPIRTITQFSSNKHVLH